MGWRDFFTPKPSGPYSYKGWTVVNGEYTDGHRLTYEFYLRSPDGVVYERNGREFTQNKYNSFYWTRFQVEGNPATIRKKIRRIINDMERERVKQAKASEREGTDPLNSESIKF